MQIAYSFFADAALEQPDGAYDFFGVRGTRRVAVVPTEIDVTLVLVVDCEPEERDREMILTVHVWQGDFSDGDRREAERIALRHRVCPPGPSGRPRLQYVPIQLDFVAPTAGNYQVEVEHDDAIWYTATYRIESAPR